MPCRSDYMEPNAREVYSRETSRLFIYAAEALLDKRAAAIATPDFVRIAANKDYGLPSHHDDITRALCELCTNMTEDEQARVIYDGRNPEARKLADWWDNHQKVDAERKVAKDYRVVYMLKSGALSTSDRMTDAAADELVARKLALGAAFAKKTKLVPRPNGDEEWVVV